MTGEATQDMLDGDDAQHVWADRYRSKIVEIDAYGPINDDNIGEAMDWIEQHGGSTGPANHDGLFAIRTLEGDMDANDGDFIIKGTRGEFYPCKPDVFAVKYERID